MAILGALDLPAPSPLVRSRLRRVLAEMRQDEGRWSDADAEARAALTEARAARAREEALETRLALVEAVSTRARLSWVWAALPEALLAGTEAVTEAGSLVADDPANLAHQRKHATAIAIVGRVKEREKHFAEALDDFTRSREIREELVRLDRANLSYERDLSIALNDVGRIMEEQGDYGAALNVFTQSLEIKKKLAERDPTNTAHQRDLAIALGHVGRINEQQVRYAEAFKDFTCARDIWLKLRERAIRRASPTGATCRLSSPTWAGST